MTPNAELGTQSATTPEAQVSYRTCPLCEACCGLEIHHQGQEIKIIRGNAEDVFSQGYICPKGVSLKDLHQDPDRLRQPMAKRDGQFVPISWDEAFAEIGARLPSLIAANGADSVACVVGNPAAHKIGLLLYFAKMAKSLGSRNIFSASTLDQMPKQLSSGLLFGSWFSIPVPDIERSQLLVILGGNPMVSNGSLWTVPDFRGRAKALRARGGRIVVIDPRRTETADIADEHLFIRPGSDVFLLLALAHTLFDEKLVRLGHLAEHIDGLEQVQAAVLPFTPEKMAARCNIDAAAMRELARALARTEGAALYGRIGTCTQEFGTLASWLIDVINILCGNLDVPGGAMFPKAAAFAANTEGKAGSGRGIITARRHSRVSHAPEVLGELPIVCLAEEIETHGAGQVKALISVASNPVLSSPNGPRLAQALEQLDFMLSIDIYINETTRHADLILPGLSPLEDMHFDVAFPQFSYRNYVRYSAPVLPLNDDRPEEWEILLRLAAIIEGKPHDLDVRAWDSELVTQQVQKIAGPYAEAILDLTRELSGPERQIELSLRSGPYGDGFGRKKDGLSLAKVKAAKHGIDLGPLQARMPEMLRTPSGKIELAPAMCLQDLPRVMTKLDEAAPALQVIGRRHVRSGNSWMHNLPVLAKGAFRCTALFHPQDAEKAGLTHGGAAILRNEHGEISVQVEISTEMMPGVISLPHGWGHDLPGSQLSLASQRPGANLNALLSDRLRDPLSGNAVLSGVAVEVVALATVFRGSRPVAA